MNESSFFNTMRNKPALFRPVLNRQASNYICGLFIIVMGYLFSAQARALELVLDTTSHTGSNNVTLTNAQGYKTLFWNFTLPSSFTGTGSANTITSIGFNLFVNPPQGGPGRLPLNIAIYNGFFTSSLYSTTSGTAGLPLGTNPTTPVNKLGDPTLGYATPQTPTLSQLALIAYTPGVNVSNIQAPILISQNVTAFNGTSPNSNGQYSIVLWTNDTNIYQIKNSGQLTISGVSNTQSSLTPGIVDGTTGTVTTTSAGSMSPAPVPEPSTYILCGLAVAALFLATRARKVQPAKV